MGYDEEYSLCTVLILIIIMMVEKEMVKILWDFNIQTDWEIKHRRPDIVVVNKEKNECTIIDVANPSDQTKFDYDLKWL